MRSVSRIKPVLSVLEEVWMKYPDMRLGQLIIACNIDWHSEDINENIKRMCDFAGFNYPEYILWGTRGEDGKKPLKYRRIFELKSSHLKAILDLEYTSEEIRKTIKFILNERESDGTSRDNKDSSS